MIKKRIDLQTKARLDAIHYHKNYYGNVPYIVHLEDVVNVLKHFGYTEDKFICAGYLHDAIEDTECSYNKVKQKFGLEIAEMVYAVTDELGRNRKEKKAKTLPKTAENPDAIIIKLADRIANMENSLMYGHSMNDVYQKEFESFREILFREEHSEMWLHLEKLLKN